MTVLACFGLTQLRQMASSMELAENPDSKLSGCNYLLPFFLRSGTIKRLPQRCCWKHGRRIQISWNGIKAADLLLQELAAVRMEKLIALAGPFGSVL